jgi:hypothetical protein
LGKGIKAPYPITIKRRNKMAMQDKGGMAGYSAAVPKKKKNKKATSKGNAKSKGDYRLGGMYSTGRAIRGKQDGTTNSRSKKDSNMKKAQERNRATSAKPSKGPSRNTNKKYR